MGASTLISDYVGVGTHAARPATPPVVAPATAIYYETDTASAFIWNGAVWVALGGGGSSGSTLGYNDTFGFQSAGSGNYILGRVMSPTAFTLNSVNIQAGTIVTGAQMTPCVYAPSANLASATGALLASGPMVTGTVVGRNVLPLSAPLALTAGEFIFIGILLNGAAIDIGECTINNAGATGTSNTTPGATGPGTGIGSNYFFWGS